MADISKVNISNSAYKIKDSSAVAFGTCTGQASNQIKAVTIADTNWTLRTGCLIGVKFDANNTYSATTSAPIKLNVNNSGAKNIYGANSSTPTGTNNTFFGATNYINFYMYDGTYWVWAGRSADNNTTYTNASLGQGYGTAGTEADGVIPVTLASYTLSVGGIVAVKFSANVNDGVSLNINSKGAKPIYYKGASIGSNVIRNGDTALFIYDGTRYHLLDIDQIRNLAVDSIKLQNVGAVGGTSTNITPTGMQVGSTVRGNTYGSSGIEVGISAGNSVSISNEELSYLDGATSNIQAQLDDLNNLEIGGRNLLKNSDKPILWLWSGSGEGRSLTQDTGQTVNEWATNTAIRAYGQAGASNRLFGLINQIYASSQISLQGQEYTFSIYIKNVSTNKIEIGTNWLSSSVDVNPNETKRIELIGTGNGTAQVQFNIYASAPNATFDFYYWHPKIEYGNKATDWTPAPEDKQDTLTAGNNISINNNVISATDTWRGIQNNLTSTSTTDSLSAYQGKLLNDNKLGYIKYAKDASTNFNNITASGIYYLDGTTMSNAPSSYLWGYLIVIAYVGVVRQIVINGNSMISSREYSGSPASWKAWYMNVTTQQSSTFYSISNFQKHTTSNNANVTANGTNYLIPLTTSDKKLKKNIKDTKINALEVISNLRHKQFDYKYEELGKDTVKIGYIAQELEEVIPESVIDIPQNEETSLGGLEVIKQIDYNAIVPYLTKAIQELADIVEEQQKVIDKYITNNESRID